ncbi:hypothetical protein VNO77_27863 [Canavalia gladiata]|uniref:Uncharacterized protein n=1 Tax=Canavalia gladiata TaxID=3824 RepID=A0AAN9KUS9_CANGL
MRRIGYQVENEPDTLASKRTFLSVASLRAINIIRKWMEDAGLRMRVDQMEIYRIELMANVNAEASLMGSHMDIVVDHQGWSLQYLL